jgi:hypothetical protein
MNVSFSEMGMGGLPAAAVLPCKTGRRQAKHSHGCSMIFLSPQGNLAATAANLASSPQASD